PIPPEIFLICTCSGLRVAPASFWINSRACLAPMTSAALTSQNAPATVRNAAELKRTRFLGFIGSLIDEVQPHFLSDPCFPVSERLAITTPQNPNVSAMVPEMRRLTNVRT